MRSELTIHLSKLDDNFRAIKNRLQSNVKVMAVIKDNAYGHGLIEIAQHLKSKADWFCVAAIEEAIELRKGGITLPILVFESPRSEFASSYKEYNITASVNDSSDFNELVEGTEYHLNFDTGMRRLGIPFEEKEMVLDSINSNKKLICTGIYTHFASADEPKNQSVPIQLERFKEIIEIFPKSLMAHTANTGAIFHYRELDLLFDAVRAGVCLYGYAAGDDEIKDLYSIIEWNSFVMQVRTIKKGESVGYGETWVAPEDGIVGTIPVGYSDGMQRSLGGKFQVLINDKLVDQVGRISMDYFGVYSPNEVFQKGDKVTIFDGKSLTPKKWADLINTIPYEVTTSLNSRLKRKYI